MLIYESHISAAALALSDRAFGVSWKMRSSAKTVYLKHIQIYCIWNICNTYKIYSIWSIFTDKILNDNVWGYDTCDELSDVKNSDSSAFYIKKIVHPEINTSRVKFIIFYANIVLVAVIILMSQTSLITKVTPIDFKDSPKSESSRVFWRYV